MPAEKLIDFIKKSPSVFHVINNFADMLKEADFCELHENEKWNVAKGGRYFVRRNNSAIIAFCIPEDDISNYLVIAGHSDSPCFKIKPDCGIVAENKYLMLNTEKYGGMIMSTWLDRPLSYAGRVLVKSEKGIETKYVDSQKMSLIIPNLAIHMDRTINEGYKYSAQTDMLPLFAMDSDKKAFYRQLAGLCGVENDKILSYDLFLYNTEEGRIWGNNGEFISSPRLDDIECAYAAINALIGSSNKKSICMACVFDNEEVGSSSAAGADSDFLESVIARLSDVLSLDRDDVGRILAGSFMVSADNAHAVHPNHPQKADPTNRPYLNGGVVIKENSAKKYTTDAVSAAVFKMICEQAGVPVQTYVNNSDIAGGMTLGNILSNHISMDSADIGLAQLAMHSSYETAGTRDYEYLEKVFEKFYSVNLKKCVDGSITI